MRLFRIGKGFLRQHLQQQIPPAVGNAAAISAIDRLTMNESPPTIVQLANAAVGPPVYMTKPNRTGIPEAKFIDQVIINIGSPCLNNFRLTVNVAALDNGQLLPQYFSSVSSVPILEQTKSSKELLLVAQFSQLIFIFSEQVFCI